MEQFRHLEKINKELKAQNDKFNATTINLMRENEKLKKALNVKNIIIENSMKSIELLKTQIEGKT